MSSFRNWILSPIFLFLLMMVSGTAEAKWVPVSPRVSDIPTLQNSACDYRLRYGYTNFGIPHEMTFDLASVDETLGGPQGEPSEQVFLFHAGFNEIRVVGFNGGFVGSAGYNEYVAKLSDAVERPFSDEIRLILNASGSNQLSFNYFWINPSAGGVIYGTTLLLDGSFFALDVDCGRSRKIHP